MESYGEILKSARESKNLDLLTISRETTISDAYLNGLENEDNSVFPSDAYMLGFMRIYAEYLDINPEFVFKLYKNKKLQESPIPEGLLAHERPKYFWPLIISLIILFLSGLITIYFIFFHSKPVEENDILLSKNAVSKKYKLDENAFSGRIYTGDQIIYPSESGNIIITVSSTLSTLGLQTPVGDIHTELAEEAELDINGDAIPDLIVYVSDISTTSSERGAEVRLLKHSGITYSSSGINQVDIPSISELSSDKYYIVFEDNRAYPFTVNASFRGACMFRSKIDRHDPSESYFTNGEIATMTAKNVLRLWMSNCNTVKLSITADGRNYDLEIGKAGQVLVEDIKWIKDASGKYKLAVIELD